MQFTVFWSHPYHGSGSSVIDAATAEIAGNEAAESLSEDLADDPEDSLEVSTIVDDLTIEVWEGALQARPEAEPEFTFT